MKKLIVLSWLTCSSLLLPAQITVTSATFPDPGDTLRYTVAANPEIAISLYTPPGGSQSWDLSTLMPTFNFETNFLPAAEGTYSAEFPEASMVVLNSTDEYYYNSTATKFEQLGHVSDSVGGLPLIARYKNYPVPAERNAPLNFFDIFVQSTSNLLRWSFGEIPDGAFTLFPTPDSIRIRISQTIIESVDAWGTLRLPGEFPQSEFPVLRLKRTTYREQRIDAKVIFLGWLDATDLVKQSGLAWAPLFGLDTTVSHHYFNDVSKEEIAVLTFNNAENAVESVVYKHILPVTSSVEKTGTASAGIQVFPNPAVSEISVSCAQLLPGMYKLKIFSTLGTVVHESTHVLSANATILEELPITMSGIYFCSLEDGKGNIVGTSSLMVVR